MFLCTLLISAALVQNAGPWQDPRKFLGQIWKVEGTVQDTRITGEVCYLNFSRDWNTDLNAVIFARDFVRFPPRPEVYYRGKIMEVSGPIGIYMGKPEIFLMEPGQIRILHAPSPAVPVRTVPPPAASRPKPPPAPAAASAAPSAAVPRKPLIYEAVGVNRQVVKVAGEGAMVILDDGSKWQILLIDRKSTVEWEPRATIVVEKMTRPLDNFGYILVNSDKWQQAIAAYVGGR